MKKMLTVVFAACVSFILFAAPNTASANEPKIGVLFSDQNEKYMDATNVGGRYTLPHFKDSMVVSEKVDYSSHLDKSTKMYALYEETGYDVHKVYDADLNSLERLEQYDAIVFPYAVLLNHTQRQNIRDYVYGGGNAQFLFAMARNELASYEPDPNKMDLTPLIYNVLTYIWEWDNLTDVFQSRFVDDVQLTNMTITEKAGSTHPILTNAYQLLGRNSIQLSVSDNSKEWIESVQPWSTSKAQPVLVYSNYTNTDKPDNIKSGQTPALLAIEHGAGRVVYATFKLHDFVTVDPGTHTWKDGTTANKIQDGKKGSDDARAVLQASMNWLTANHTNFVQRFYNVQLSTANLVANMTPQKKFALRGSVTAKNTGNVPARGYLKVEALDANNKVLGQYEKLLTGLAPDNLAHASYAEKFEILLPGSIKDGAYKLKVSFKEARHDKKASGYVTRAETLVMTKKGNKGSYKALPTFKDVSSGSHLANINNAAKIGIITGYTDGTFKPAANVSRLQAMTMMLRAMGVSPSASAALPATVTDLKKGAYGYDVIATAYNLGLINIEANNKINASAPMRRGEMAQALVKGFKLTGNSTLTFTDIGTAQSYKPYGHIATLYHHRITTGTTASLFAPYEPVSRAQFATFIMRSLESTSK